MIPVTFPECNVVLGMSQDEYAPLQAYRAPDGQTICAFRLSPQELKEVLETRTLWISVLTFNQPFQPIGLSTQCPFVRPAPGEVPAPEASLVKALERSPRRIRTGHGDNCPCWDCTRDQFGI